LNAAPFNEPAEDRNGRAVFADRRDKAVIDRKCSSPQRSVIHMLPNPRHKLVTLANVCAALIAIQEYGCKFDRACQGFVHSVTVADVLGDLNKTR
jgi:hypothetical protein